jgi:hypothetical protein
MHEQTSRGRILRVKRGYNPNSSSMGTLLVAFPCALFGSAVLFNTVASLVLLRKLKPVKKNAPRDGRQE